MRISKREREMRLKSLSNPEISDLIDKWVRGEINREILKLRLIDELCLEPLAEKVGLSVQQAKARLYKSEEQFFSHI